MWWTDVSIICLDSFEYISRSAIGGSQDSSIFSFCGISIVILINGPGKLDIHVYKNETKFIFLIMYKSKWKNKKSEIIKLPEENISKCSHRQELFEKGSKSWGNNYNRIALKKKAPYNKGNNEQHEDTAVELKKNLFQLHIGQGLKFRIYKQQPANQTPKAQTQISQLMNWQTEWIYFSEYK